MHNPFCLKTKHALMSDETIVTIRFARGMSAYDQAALELVFKKMKDIMDVGTQETLKRVDAVLGDLRGRETEAWNIFHRLQAEVWEGKMPPTEKAKLLARYKELRPTDPDPLSCSPSGCG